MFHLQQRFTYKGHLVCIGIEAEWQSALTNGNQIPVFLKTPVLYIDNIKISLDAETGRSVREPLDIVARQIIEEMPQPVVPIPVFRLRREYWRESGKRIGLNLMGGGLLVTAFGLAMLASTLIVLFLLFLLEFRVEPNGSYNVAGMLYYGTTFLLMGGFAWICGWFGLKSIKRATQIDPGIPLTRANTADLPASESLVRASEEPVQEQVAVLLRAAIETPKRHEEQLVRAVDRTE